MTPGIDDKLIGLGIALGFGPIVGMEREWQKDKPVGLRRWIWSCGVVGIGAGVIIVLLWPVPAGA